MLHERCSSGLKFAHWQVMSIFIKWNAALNVVVRNRSVTLPKLCLYSSLFHLSFPDFFWMPFWRTPSDDWISSWRNPWWPIQMFDFHIYSNCWITASLLRPISFNYMLEIIDNFFVLICFQKTSRSLHWRMTISWMLWYTLQQRVMEPCWLESIIQRIQSSVAKHWTCLIQMIYHMVLYK